MSDTDQRQEQDAQSPVPASRVLGELAADLRSLIDTTRLRVARTVNAELVMLYWEIGSRIRRDILCDARAEYGIQIVSTLSRQLTAEYGAGFSRQNLFHMIRFVEAWPQQAQMSVLAQHLGWSPFQGNLVPGKRVGAPVLCRDVPTRAVERPHAPRSCSQHDVRTYRGLPK
jgi:hypothetical protein